MASLVITIIFIALLVLGTPLFVAIGAATAACFIFVGQLPIAIMAQQMFTVADRDILLALPFFCLTYKLMTTGSSARRLVDFTGALIGWLPGGVALAAILASIIFAALSGFSPVAIVAVGGLLFPGLVKSGFGENFSLGLVTAAGSLGTLVPPSIVVLMFGIIGEVNIINLFVASLTPLVIVTVLFSIYAVFEAKRRGVARAPFNAKVIAGSFKSGFWALTLPVIIIGGLYSGRLDVNQAAATAVVFAIFIEIFIYRTVKLKQMPAVFRESATLVGTLLIIISLMFALNWFFTVQGVSARITEFVATHFQSKWLFLLTVNILLLLLGGLMDNLSAMFITVPLLLPAAVAMGVDPVHFGVIYIMNFEIGCLTPPVGINIFTSSVVFHRPVHKVFRATLPFLAILLVVLALITYIPSLSLWPMAALGR